MLTVFKLVFPILTVITVGYLAARFQVLPSNTGSILCRYLFYFSLPFLTFQNIYLTGLDNLLNVDFILTALCAIFLVILLSLPVHRFLFQIRGSELIMMVFGSFYVNATYMGMPVTDMVLGSVTPPLIILMLQASFFFPAIIFLLDLRTKPQTRFELKNTLLLLTKNPLMIAAALAVLSLFLRIDYPDFILSALDLLGKPAAPLGLFALGFTCYLPADKRITPTEIQRALTITVFKVLIQPLIAWLIGKHVFHLDNWWLAAVVICAMLPTAVNHFVASQQYKISENESKLLILFTTFGFTIVFSLYLLIFRPI